MKAIVQIRGEVNRQEDVQDTLSMLNIHNVNHCTLVPETDPYGDDCQGQRLRRRRRARRGRDRDPAREASGALEGKQADVDEEWLADNTEYDTFGELADALLDEETTLRDEGLSPTLRLHPPRGHDGIKKPTVEGGQLGKHTTGEINDLPESMR